MPKTTQRTFVRLLRLFVCAAAFQALTPIYAKAQTPAQITQAREAARMHFGSFLLRPSLSITDVGIDDNVFVDPDGTDHQSDFAATVTPQGQIWLPVAGRALLSATGSAAMIYYKHFDSERAINPGASFMGTVFLRRLTLAGSFGVLRARERPSFEIDKRSQRTEFSGDASIAYQVRPKLSVSLAAFRRSTSYDQDEAFLGTKLRDSLNRFQGGGRLTVTQRLTPKTSVDVQVESAVARYQFSKHKDADSFLLSPGVIFEPTALIAGSAHLGFRRYSPLKRDLPEYAGLAADMELAYTMRSATKFTAKWRRDIGQSFNPVQPYYVINGVGGKIRRQIVKQLDVIAGISQDDYTYEAVATVPGAIEHVDSTRILSLDLGMRLNRYSRVGFVVSRTNRNSSTRSDRNYGRTTAGLSFHYGIQQ